MKVLLIDDDLGLRRTAALILADEGFQVFTAADAREGLESVRAEAPEIVLCDVRMPGIDGLAFLDHLREEEADPLVVMMTAYGSTDIAVEAIRRGAYDYIEKPFSPDVLSLRLKIAEENRKKDREIVRLRREVGIEKRHSDIVAGSKAMMSAIEMAERVASHPTTVLITGESGTGKELIARHIHQSSKRHRAPFIAVNCGAIPEALLESELFGHTKGAFTGATADRTGLFEEAHGGTLLLDEIGELPQNLQVKLLRALQEGEIRRVGESKPRQVDVRIITATARDLKQEVENSAFRADLYYRINVLQIHLPPLRHRLDDIPLLVEHFVSRYNETLELDIAGFSPGAMKRLLAYRWSGNVRELENVVERAMVLADESTIEEEQLPTAIRAPESTLDVAYDCLGPDELSVKKRSAQMERRLIARALELTGGNRSRAAGMLDLSYRALLYKIRDYELE